jgi:MoxR-like ATPase
MADRQISDPSLYNPAPGLIDALNAALILGQPLLLTGDPGCGKTEAANYLAWRLGLDGGAEGRQGDAARRFDVKSTTSAKDLFYSFDVIARFYAAQVGEDTSAERFLSLNALGRAILEASDDPAGGLREQLLGTAAVEARRSVVLIDEIDKAPRDVPNDLLVEFDKLRFHVPEISRTFAAAPDLRPIIVLTSNRERDLPDAFLRRCIVFSVPFPNDDQLRDIIDRRIPGMKRKVVDEAVHVARGLRSANLRRAPGTAELLSFVAALKGVGLAEADSVAGSPVWQQIARTTLLKNSRDHEEVSDRTLSGFLTG